MITGFGILMAACCAAVAVFMLAYVVATRVAHEFAPIEAKVRARRMREQSRRPYVLLNLASRLEPYVPERFAKLLARLIVRAGGLEGLTSADVVLYSFIGLCLTSMTGLLILVATPASPYLVVAIAFAGAVLPTVWLRDQVKKRHAELLRDLPFHLDLLTLSVEAGLDFAAAVARMVDKGRAGALREEFNSFLGEIRMGKTRAEALQAMSDRVGLPQLSTFLSALIQADRLGSGLGRTLRLQSEQLRNERFQRAEKLAGEAPVKMLLPLVMFIFPTIWIILAAPLLFEWFIKGVM